MLSAICFNLDQCRILSSGNGLSKGENAGNVVTSIFSVLHKVFYTIKEEFWFLATFSLSSANAFNLDQSNDPGKKAV